jgi:hypothetical protein
MLDKSVDQFLKDAIKPKCLEKFGDVVVNCLLDDGTNGHP